jgi:hypothetical protein
LSGGLAVPVDATMHLKQTNPQLSANIAYGIVRVTAVDGLKLKKLASTEERDRWRRHSREQPTG